MWTRVRFDEDLKRGKLLLAFIGMSNAGKSERASKLRKQAGFVVADIDALIQKKLGLRDMKSIAGWLGYPDSPHYAERARAYLEAEDFFTREACEKIQANTIIDTTGSVAHLPEVTQDVLHEHALVVHLKVEARSQHSLIENFFANPKPVIWGAFFRQEGGENTEAALRHSYPRLLEYRLGQYKKLAHVTLPAERIYSLKGPALLERIRTLLA